MASLFKRFLWTFYIVDRNSTTFEHVEDVPDYEEEMVPIFLILIISEAIFKYLKDRKRKVRLYDGVASLSTGIILQVTKMLTRGVELIAYQWMYEHRLLNLDWKSPYTWWIALIGVDFCYYWIHRAAHEITFLWCGHQTHHSSEEFNYTTAMRVSPIEYIFNAGLYQPLALLGVPLPALFVHLEFNNIFQFWIHTDVITNLGPLEWIFNTASHHRVHHGINKWCQDKNYAGFLIIWDRMFGTFQKERKDEKIVYGLVSQPQTFNTFYLQVFYFNDIVHKAWSMTSWSDAFKILFYGPGWSPGTSRLGDENAIPDKTPERVKYSTKQSLWVDCYVVLHFIVTIIVYQKFMMTYATFNWSTALVFMDFIFLSFFTFGSIFDGRWWAPLVETARCIATVALLRNRIITITANLLVDSIITGYFAVSILIWSSHCLGLIASQKLKYL